MKILDIAESYLSEKPADHAGIFIHRQSLTLMKCGYDIRVITPQPLLSRNLMSQFYPYHSEKDGIGIFRPRFFYIPRIIRPGKVYDNFYSRAIQKTCKTLFADWVPDLIICDWIIPGGLASYQLSKKMRIPLILRARGGDVRIMSQQVPKLNKYYQTIGDQASFILCNGFGIFEDLSKFGIFDPQKLHVFTNGIDTEVFHPASIAERNSARAMLKIPATAHVWVFIGTWAKHKGSTELAQIVPPLLSQFPDAYFVVAGPIRDQDSKEAILAVKDQARFLGMVSTEQIVKCLHAADLFILPSHMEGLPNSLIEAMSCGVASIASSVGGVPSIIRNNMNGLLIDPKNTMMLEKIILRCLNDTKLTQELGINARRTIFELGLDMKSIASQLDELFQSCVTTKGESKEDS